MCGNLGLLITVSSETGQIEIKVVPTGPQEEGTEPQASALKTTAGGTGVHGLNKPGDILRHMVAATEVRGGQAGGLSAFESKLSAPEHPKMARVRAVARKRYPLADDLKSMFNRSCPKGTAKGTLALSVIGHTRFATGSVNTLPELHPHDWYDSGYAQDGEARGVLGPVAKLVPFGMRPQKRPKETVWVWDEQEGELMPIRERVTVHLTHNGDFDALEAYGGQVLNAELGLWIERVLQAPNSTSGDSPKLAGMMDILRVQGRWGPAARLAWLRVICSNPTDITGGEPLSKDAPFHHMPAASVWFHKWAPLFEAAWERWDTKLIKPFVLNPGRYTINLEAVAGLREDVISQLSDRAAREAVMQGAGKWTGKQVRSFVHQTIRGFLRSDLYVSLTELLARAEGSFGIQAHCSLEPGVVVIGSKGQSMQVAFSDTLPIVLFGSEAAAVRAPVTPDGKPLPWLLALDELGEVVRVGPPADLMDGTYTDFRNRSDFVNSLNTAAKLVAQRSKSLATMATRALTGTKDNLHAAAAAGGGKHANETDTDKLRRHKHYKWHKRQKSSTFGSRVDGLTGERKEEADKLLSAHALILGGGVELRAYSLLSCVEHGAETLRGRAVKMEMPTLPPPKGVDLVELDLAETPKVLQQIDNEWDAKSKDNRSAAVITADSFWSHLERLMLARKAKGNDSIDLLIGAIETSLWLAEQFASDLVATFPHLAVRCVSANQLLGVGGFSPQKTFFSGDQLVDVDDLGNAAVLLVSHSGQTFPTLHATRLLDKLCPGRVWLMTGMPFSQMEQSLRNAHTARGQPPPVDRIFVTKAGNRPAEPTSLAAAAMQHTFTHLLLHMISRARSNVPPKHTKQHWETKPSSFALGGRAAARPVEPLVRLDDGGLADLRLMSALVVPSVEAIVGAKASGERAETETHAALVKQGHKWAAHISEPWIVLCLVGAYVIASVTLGAPIAWVLANMGLRAAAVDDQIELGWSAVRPDALPPSQHVGFTVLGFVVRFLDALIYVYCGKLLTWAARVAAGRPLWARMGKRALVIVDTKTNNQMLEMFCSKLFALSYSFNGLEVHGANGVDHFVHTFTHRVARGLLLAVGRPDGRLCCLAKTEQALLLACKQAIFIQNPQYSMAPNSGNAPEVFSVGHNPMAPGYITQHVALPSKARRRFIDELVYRTMIQSRAAQTPKAVLRQVAERAAAGTITRSRTSLARGMSISDLKHTGVIDAWNQLPYGTQYITKHDDLADTPADGLVRRRIAITVGGARRKEAPEPSNDPGIRLSFMDKLDAKTDEVQDRQIHLQRFYESRIASLERYLAFCVTFHAMADHACRPWLRRGWQVERSQSNLRVATTAAPISASDAQAEDSSVPMEVLMIVRQAAAHYRGFVSHF